MLKLSQIRNAVPVVALSLAAAFPAPAHAMDWGVFTSVVNIISSLFAPAPQIVPPRPQVVNQSTPNYGSYDPGSTGYPISQSSGVYRYVGPNGETYTVDNTRGYDSLPVYQSPNEPYTKPDQKALTNNPSTTYSGGSYPWPTNGGPISSTYGNRERVGRMCHKDDVGTGTTVQHCGVHAHNGLDIAVPSGASVSSIASGKVVWISPACKGGAPGEAGCVVSIMKPDGEMASYMHLSGTKNGLKVGDELTQGQPFAFSGNSGTATTGAHLHFEMCQVPPNKANGKTSPRELCAMGERLNPLAKLSKSDPRYQTACRMSERNPLNANIKPPCAYKAPAKKQPAPAPTPAPVDTRQSTVAKGLYGN